MSRYDYYGYYKFNMMYSLVLEKEQEADMVSDLAKSVFYTREYIKININGSCLRYSKGF